MFIFLFKGFTPLIYAAQYGHLDIVEFYVSHGADVNVKDNDGKFIIFFFHCVETICFLSLIKIQLHIK